MHGWPGRVVEYEEYLNAHPHADPHLQRVEQADEEAGERWQQVNLYRKEGALVKRRHLKIS